MSFAPMLAQDTPAPDADEAAVVVEEAASAEGVDIAEDPEGAVGALADEAKQDAMNAFDGLMQGDLEAAWPLIEKYVVPLVIAIVVLIVGIIISKIVAKMVGSMIRKAKVDETLARFFGKLVFYAGVILTLIAAAGQLGIQTTGFAAVIAAAGFAVGMALSGTLGSFAAGVMLLIFRPFKVGDVVNAAGVTAKVHEIELFTTTLDTPDNRRIIVPNSAIYGGTIENISHHDDRRCDVSVGVAYDADLDKTREVLEAAANSIADMRLDGEGRGHQIVLGDLGDSAVGWTVRFWCKAADYWGVKEALTRAVKNHLDEAGLGIPFPQMDVHVSRLDDAG
ncbi:MAG: mechanosensitive ion channel domain-containing protein [Planctomycetota bacterium]